MIAGLIVPRFPDSLTLADACAQAAQFGLIPCYDWAHGRTAFAPSDRLPPGWRPLVVVVRPARSAT